MSDNIMSDLDWIVQQKTKLGSPTPDYSSTPPQKKKKAISYQPMPPLTDEEWAAMTPKAKWDCIVALRGPDLRNSDLLKWFTSSVVRYKLSKVMRVGGMVNNETPYIVISPSPKDIGQFSLSHFWGHIVEAANWLHIPIIYADAKMWDLILKDRHGYGRTIVYAYHWAILPDEDPIKPFLAWRLLQHGIMDIPSYLAQCGPKEEADAQG